VFKSSLGPPVNAQLGAIWIRPAHGMTMIYIPAGEFLMGSADSDPNAGLDEKPQRTVYLDAYWIDQTEVTNAQYALCVADGKCKMFGLGDFDVVRRYYTSPRYSDNPVLYVSWEDASNLPVDIRMTPKPPFNITSVFAVLAK
jgi:eukaryotic-like serine/threonine-protein kinase